VDIDVWASTEEVRVLVKECMAKCKPMVIIELGTFTGVGTQAIANFVSTYSDKQANLYTFDGLSEVVYQDVGIDKFSYRLKGPTVDLWPEVIAKRNARISQEYPNCQITFIEGIIRDTLPRAMLEIGEWDFCFHDSTHSPHLQLEDFRAMEPWSHIGSMILFDDADQGFMVFFLEQVNNWTAENVSVENRVTGLLVAERVA